MGQIVVKNLASEIKGRNVRHEGAEKYLLECLVLINNREVDAEVEAWASGVQGVGQRHKVVDNILLISELAISVEVDKEMLRHNTKII